MNYKNIEYHFCGRSQDYDSIYHALTKKGVSLLSLNQVHEAKITVIDDPAKAVPFLRDPRPDGDGFITNQKLLALSVHTADCLPIIATDGNWIGICHAGWKGIEKNILEKFIEAFENVGVFKDRLLIYIGPSIDVKCFEVHNDVATRLSHVNNKPIPDLQLEKIVRPHRDAAKKFVDLKALAYFRLTNERIKEKSITISSDCTYERRDFYHSYRRDGKEAGRNESFIYKY